jgi:hypothetical protein
MNNRRNLCESSQSNLFRISQTSVQLVRSKADGVFIAQLDLKDDLCSRSRYDFCGLLYRMRLDVGFPPPLESTVSLVEFLAQDDNSASSMTQSYVSRRQQSNLAGSYKLRALSFLQNYDGIKYDEVNTHSVFKDSIQIVVVPAGFDGDINARALRSHLWANGHLSFVDTSQPKPATIHKKLVPRQFEPQAVLQWLEFCSTCHMKLCCATVDVPNLRVIDCEDSSIILAPETARYLALSYVWGPSTDASLHRHLPGQEQDSRPCLALPFSLPKVVEDAMQVTKQLRF